MPRVETGQPHQLAYLRRFHRVVRLLGCALLLMGLVVAVVPRLHRRAHPKSAELIATAAIGGAAAAAGALLLLARRGKLFDTEAGTLTDWWGLPWPVLRTRHALAEFNALSIEAADDRPAPRWRVALQGSQGAKLEIFTLADPAAAQAAAAQIGAFLALPVLTGGDPGLGPAVLVEPTTTVEPAN